ncbi:sortilin-related receptor-like [Salmo trutta]|uniref:sortilin-related receptor-like n=1 Tax=Salmo trutta TaxID=8032 RepID=UPI001131BC0C|nr:sortilin-related receptor-like [Salmo trutta]
MSSSRYLNETYTNMATRQTVKMLSPLRFTIYLLFFFSPGTFSSTLRLHRDQRFLLPQDRGFSTVNAKEEFIQGIGADAKRRAARSAREDIAPGMYQHRNRRSAVEPPVPKVYGQANLNDSHNQMVVHWAGEKSNVIVALARDSVGATGPKTSSVYVSYDYGTSFSPISERFQLSGEKEKEGNKQVISQFYHSPADNKRYLFADSTNSYLWNSFDFCKTIQGFSIPFKPTDLLLHSKRANLVLGYDSSHPNKQLWKSDDFGETWVLIQEHVKAYFWGVEPYDSPTTVLVQRHEPQGVSSILSSTDFFQSGQNRRVILERVDNFQLRDKYMFATTSTTLLGSHEPSSVQLWVSYNRQPMKAAQFMTRHPITEYYIADASEDQVFVCVNHVNNVTHLYISDTQGLSFSLSLENVLYYSPEGSGSHTLIRYFASEPFADLHRVEGLRGVFVATLINGSLSEDNMRSVITFDKGGTWELLQAPSADSLGGTLDCQLKCYVYLNLFLSLVFLGGVTPHTPAPGPSSCAPNRFRCGSGACIVNSWVCDGYADCPDGSDELGCPTGTANSTATQAPWPTHAPPLPPGRCSKGQFLCRKPPTCIPDWQRCDGHQHCLDGSDEAHCPTRGPLTCVNGTRCADGEACLLDGEKCDGFMDCSDHSDEDNCTSDSLVYKIQNLRWTADFSGAITLTWSRPKNLPLASCYFLIYYRLVGTQQWTSMDTHSNKSSYTLSVLKPDTTYQVKVLTQCLSKQHKTNDVLTLRTPEGLPDPPRNLQLSCDNGEDGTVEASWSVPDKAHGLIREYIVEYSEKGVEWFSQRSTGNGVEVKNLLPSTLYKFRVAAVTGRGMGNWTEVKSIIPKKALPPPSVITDSITEDSMSLSFSFNSQYEVRQYVVVLSWVFDAHVKESRNYTVRGSILKAANLTTGTIYEVAVWAQTGVGDSPTALSRQQTKGTQPEPPLLKARALNQSSVDCSWTVTGSPAQVYGIFFATSFLDLYRSPHSVNTSSSSRTVAVDSDEQYLFLVRAISPYLGPPSEYAVVKMIPNERLPPRNLHKVRVEKTQAMLKWQPPYDSPSAPLTYAVHLKDVVRKTESSYKLTTQNNTVEYCLKGLEPGGHYSVSVRLRNMSKEASYTLNTMPLPAPEALKILTEKDHVFLFWKSLAVKERSFNESRGYEVHVYDSLSNSTVLLGNTTETFFRISSLLAGHNYTFSVQARCLLNGQLCGKSALLLYDQLGQGPSEAVRSSGQSGDMAVVVVPVLFLLLLGLCGGLVVLYLRHRRLQNNFTAFANSHYNSRLGSAIFSSGDELGDDDEDAPMISGFSDDVPMVIA